jgi:uncharacterized membrane protein YraQ (UPF0718 family)
VNIIDIYFYIIDKLQGTYTLRILQNFFDLVLQIAPYFLISILIQVILKRLFPVKKLVFGSKSEKASIFLGAVVGLISPLPTYAAVPIGFSFLVLGTPFSAIMAFIIASPLMNPAIFYLTYTQLGMKMAMARVIASFILALFGGFLVQIFFKSPGNEINTKLDRIPSSRRSLIQDFNRNCLFLGRYFLIAIMISAAIKALVPAEWITRILGSQVHISLVIAIALGVPFYSCGGAAIPLIEVLQEMGMSHGAALAFFIAGPATKLETLYIFKNLLSLNILSLYLLITLIGAYLSGLIFMLF